MNTIKRIIICIFSVLTVLGVCGCSKEETKIADNNNGWASETVMVGSGKTRFDLEVIDDKGNLNKYKVATDKKTVGEALTEIHFLVAENHGHGTHIMKVNGIEAKESEQEYWEFYIDGKVSTQNVFATEIEQYKIYGFKFKK